MQFIAKKTGYGDYQWKGFMTQPYNKGLGNTYVIVGHGHTDSRETVLVRKSLTSKGWDVVLFGEVVSVERTKIDAQHEAIALLES